MKMKNNIYIFNELTPAGDYGIGTYISQIKGCFYNDEYVSVKIIELCSKQEEFYFDKDSNTLHVPRGVRYSHDKRKQYLQGVIRLLALKIDSKEDITFIFNFFTHSILIDLVRVYFPKSRIIFTVHYLEWTFLNKGNMHSFINALDKTTDRKIKKNEKLILYKIEVDRCVFEKADHIICLSKFTYNLLLNYYCIDKTKISTIYNGLKDVVNSSLPSKVDLRKELCISSKEKIILYVGRLHKDKGGRELIKAFRLILKDNPNSRLVIVGNGDIELYQKQSESIWSKIIYTGRINKEQVYKFIQIADVGVLPSFSEQCSYVAIEMMMFGLPIVGTNSTGLEEMIEEGVTGYKVKLLEMEHDVLLPEDQLADRISKLLNMAEIKTISNKSRQRFLDYYTIEKMHYNLKQIISTNY